jgi:hypothetical protein
MPVRRALIGFSSPVGYSYAFQAPRSANDGGSSPNPVLMGSMGLFTLYDELWFACESLCPRTMRALPLSTSSIAKRPDWPPRHRDSGTSPAR